METDKFFDKIFQHNKGKMDTLVDMLSQLLAKLDQGGNPPPIENQNSKINALVS